MRHANISIFVPHLGCPNDCSFCNQRHITGQITAPGPKDIDDAVNTAVSSADYCAENTEIAFFGGSFTAIEPEYMHSLLSTAYKHIASGQVCGIRISTRPDCIDNDILSILKEYGVTSIELGAQSLDDEVLFLNDRGHTARDVVKASKLIKEAGFKLGLQMMTGLYGDSFEKSLSTAQKIIWLAPDTVRIYPTVVLKNTRLAAMYADGTYKPQSLEEAVRLCAVLCDMFDEAGIRVIRTGLHSIEEGSYVAGPWHPAFSELCESERFYKRITDMCVTDREFDVFVNPHDISKVLGQKRSNALRLKNNGYNIRFIQSDEVQRNTIRCKEVKKA